MHRKTRPYSELRQERLTNPEVAAAYLNATIENSPDSFLAALMNVARARQVSKVADEAGLQRETLYRSLSEQGNPTLDTLSSVLSAVGLRLSVSVADTMMKPQAYAVSSTKNSAAIVRSGS